MISISPNPGDVIVEKLAEREVAHYLVIKRDKGFSVVEYECVIMWVETKLWHEELKPGETWFVDSFNLNSNRNHKERSFEILSESGLSWTNE